GAPGSGAGPRGLGAVGERAGIEVERGATDRDDVRAGRGEADARGVTRGEEEGLAERGARLQRRLHRRIVDVAGEAPTVGDDGQVRVRGRIHGLPRGTDVAVAVAVRGPEPVLEVRARRDAVRLLDVHRGLVPRVLVGAESPAGAIAGGAGD